MIIPDYCEPIVAHRSWRVMANGLLSGLAIAQPWRPRRAIEATCNGHDQARTGDIDVHLVGDEWIEAPAKECVCGIYAAKQRADVEKELTKCRSAHDNGGWWGYREVKSAGWAIGAAYLWGRIIEHEKGYRAQYAYPKALTVYGDQALADRVAHLYGVTVTREDVPKPKEPEYWISGITYNFKPITISGSWLPAGSAVSFADPDPSQAIEEQREAKARAAAEKERERQKAARRGWKVQPWV